MARLGQMMLILNCTKAAADFFSESKKGQTYSPLEPAPIHSIAESNHPLQWQWLVHTVKVNNKNVLIAMDYKTRFSITLSGLKKGDESRFLNDLEQHLIVHVHEMMSAIDADPEVIEKSLDRYRDQHNSRAFYLRGDRSVQAHINDVAWHIRRRVDEIGHVPSGVDLISLDVFANGLLRQRKADKSYFYPQREFLHAWLIQYAEHSRADADACIAYLKAKERASFAARHPDLIASSASSLVSMPTQEPRDLTDNIISLDAYRKKKTLAAIN